VPNKWQHVSLAIPGDKDGQWLPNGAGVGMFFQICMASGEKYQTKTANQWQDGDHLMPVGVTNTSFLTTDGATFYVTGLALRYFAR